MDAALPRSFSAPFKLRAATIACIGFFVVLWGLIFNQQRLEWSVNVVYSYGWAVPALAGYLFWERWRSRPAPLAEPLSAWWLVVPALLVLAFLPVRVIQEANPDWVKINWLMAGLAMGLTILATVSWGGWRYGVHFVFPVLFCLTALPWPVWMEEYLVQTLMRWNAVVSAEVMTLSGFPALAQGNLIQVGSTWVNVEEACSGIRSLQTAFMMSLFFGEFYRLGILLRGGLLVASFAVAFVLNLLRTFVLTYLTAQGGEAAVDKWHDTVGTVVMVLCLVLLWALAELAKRIQGGGEPAPGSTRPVWAPFPAWFAFGALAWLVVAEVATESWYRRHESKLGPPVEWTVAWPERESQYRRMEFGERTKAILKYNEGETASWRTSEGNRWQMYYLRWYPGRVSQFLSASHYPTVCLPATGLRLKSQLGTWPCTVGDVTFLFTIYLFDEGGRDLYVFHAIIEDRPRVLGEQIVYRQVNTDDRLASTWRGERNLGQRVIGISVNGPFSVEEAKADVQASLARLVTGPDFPPES